VQLVTDQSDQVLRHQDYLPFAEEYHAAGWVPENPPHGRKLFTGQERDFETGLDYFHARQLRVDLGRFTAPDPLIDLAWTDTTLGAANAYGYVESNPLGVHRSDGDTGSAASPAQSRTTRRDHDTRVPPHYADLQRYV
jgi:RHS repeat-associated protein